jgi:hypothetical protein
MIKLTNIEAFILTENKKAVSELLYKWNVSKTFNDHKRLERFRHLLRWYVLHTTKKDVVIIFTYSEEQPANPLASRKAM